MYGIYVYKASVARQLIKMGYRVIDIKPGRTINGDLNFQGTIFVFQNDSGLNDAIKQLVAKD